MSRHDTLQHDPQLRLLIAQSAARMMAEEGVRDFALAKRRAAAQYGVVSGKNLPGNDEVQAALEEYQRLFRSHVQPQIVQQLRHTALQAMRLLADFRPCLVGPILNGSADEYTPVYLHLFADTPEEVLLFLLERQIPFEQGERQVQYASGKRDNLAKFSFLAGETEIQLTVFPPQGRRQPPLSPVDGRPQQRAERKQLEALMAADQSAG
ncbi:MAG: hypothetical protein OQK54_02025 [Gammaproteobacteria bacterium]|nr:hypothetical protein [Gammaproteobacteria bacterium]